MDLMDRVDRVDRPMLYLNLLLLTFVAAIPFATSTLAEYLRESGASGRAAGVRSRSP